ncbi:MAG: putative nucleotide-diphospho-sugar transferase [Cyanobacteria bacterium P01_F01_bin.150]
MNKDIPDSGYLYAAFGNKYIAEAVQSAQSLKSVDPSAHITIVSNETVRSSVFDHHLLLESELEDDWKLGLTGKTHSLALTPYHQTIFLDTDTYVLYPIGELFDLLKYFDICMAMAPADLSPCQVNNELISALTPYNTGVIAFRKTERVSNFLNDWHDEYKNNTEIYSGDQPAFMKIFATSDIKMHSLHQHYNARTNLAFSLPGALVKIIHGRHKDFPAIAMRLNQKVVNRSWCPVLQDIITLGPSITPLNLLWRCLKRLNRGLQ